MVISYEEASAEAHRPLADLRTGGGRHQRRRLPGLQQRLGHPGRRLRRRPGGRLPPPRLRGRALEFRRDACATSTPWRPRWSTPSASGRATGGHRHAEPSRVDRVVRRHPVDRRHLRLDQCLVDRRPSSTTPSRTRAVPARRDPERVERATAGPHAAAPGHCGRATDGRSLPDGVQRYEDVVTRAIRCPPSPCDPTTTPPSSTPRGPPGFPEGSGLDPSGGVSVAHGLLGRAASTRRPGRGAVGPARARPVLHPDRPALPRHRLCPRDALVLRHEAEAGDDVPLGPGGALRAHRGRARSRPSSASRPRAGTCSRARPSPSTTPRRSPPSAAGEHRHRPARRRGSRVLLRGTAQHRLRHDRDERFRPGQHRRRLRDPPVLHRSGPDHHPRHRDPGRSTARRARPASEARSG